MNTDEIYKWQQMVARETRPVLNKIILLEWFERGGILDSRTIEVKHRNYVEHHYSDYTATRYELKHPTEKTKGKNYIKSMFDNAFNGFRAGIYNPSCSEFEAGHDNYVSRENGIWIHEYIRTNVISDELKAKMIYAATHIVHIKEEHNNHAHASNVNFFEMGHQLTSPDFVPINDSIASFSKMDKGWISKGHSIVEATNTSRSQVVVNDINEMYDCCAICGEKLVEVHHMIPFSKDPLYDVVGNLIPLCANHHKMADRGLFSFDTNGKISSGDLRIDGNYIHLKHKLLPKSVEYCTDLYNEKNNIVAAVV